MRHQTLEQYFLLIILGAVLVLSFFIFKPFLSVLVLAIVCATVFAPLHERILAFTGNRSGISAAIATLSVLIVVIVPIAFLSVQILEESRQLSTVIVESGPGEFTQSVASVLEKLTGSSLSSLDISGLMSEYLTGTLTWLLSNLGTLFASLAKVFLGIFLFLLALYYLFKDGRAFKQAVIAFSPLQDAHDESIFATLGVAINSVIRGSLGVALTQGILTGIGFGIFGVPHPTLWGSAAALAALIPGVGTALVIAPAVLYLFFTGSTVFAAGLFVWGVLAVGLVDNLLGPKLVGRGLRLHSFLILLSILGGLTFFGPIGFVLGPLTLSLLFALLQIHLTVTREHAETS